MYKALLGIAVVLLAVLLWRSSTDLSTNKNELRLVRLELNELRTQTDVLESELQHVREALAQASPQPIDALGAELEVASNEPVEAAAVTAVAAPIAAEATGSDPVADPWLAAGLDDVQADAMKLRIDELRWQRLNLQYALSDESRADEVRRELRAIPSVRDLVTEAYGDAVYDQYLYAANRRNRVVVSDVMRNSPAEQIGLQPGDTLYSANGRRVFHNGDLYRAVSQADGNPVSLVVHRGSVVIEADIAAGPIGVVTSSRRVNPAPQDG